MDEPHVTVMYPDIHTRDWFREQLVRHHMGTSTHGPWLGRAILRSPLCEILRNPRAVAVTAALTRPTKNQKFASSKPQLTDRTNVTDAESPFQLHRFGQWAPLIAMQYSGMNGLANLDPLCPSMESYSQRQYCMLLAVYVWDNCKAAEIVDALNGLISPPGVQTKVEQPPLTKTQGVLVYLQKQGLLTVRQDEEGKVLEVGIPPSLPIVALTLLDIAASCGGGWKEWEELALQYVGVRFAAMTAWQAEVAVDGDCTASGVRVEDILPELNSEVQDWLVEPAEAGRRGWTTVPSDVHLNGSSDGEERFWKETVLPLLEHNSVVLVLNKDKSAAADGFALVKLRGDGTTTTTRPALLIARLQMKDYSHSSTVKLKEELPKLGVHPTDEIHHQSQVLTTVFKSLRVTFGWAFVMSQTPTHSKCWSKLQGLRAAISYSDDGIPVFTKLANHGVMFPSPVVQAVFMRGIMEFNANGSPNRKRLRDCDS